MDDSKNGGVEMNLGFFKKIFGGEGSKLFPKNWRTARKNTLIYPIFASFLSIFFLGGGPKLFPKNWQKNAKIPSFSLFFTVIWGRVNFFEKNGSQFFFKKMGGE